MRDSQRSAVYAWERQIPGWPFAPMDLAACAALVRDVWADYRPGATPPIVSDGRGRRSACGSRWEIKLPRWARTRGVVLHEIGHSLASMDRHGPVYARLYLDLLARYAGVDEADARRRAEALRPRRVAFAALAACPRPDSAALRRWRAWHNELKRRQAAILAEIREHEAAKPKE